MNPPKSLQLANVTPLQPLEKTRAALGCQQPLLIKRDDLTGLELSGNKIRKLQYILAAARDDNVDAIVTEGTWQSNHCRATAIACAKLGMKCVLLTRPRVPAPPQGNLFLNLLVGAEIREYDRPDFDDNRSQIVAQVLGDLRSTGHNPRFVPMGASEPLGCWGYIEAAKELTDQCQSREDIQIENGVDLVTAASSCGTVAGLILGKRIHGLNWLKIHAIPVSDDAATLAAETRTLCQNTIKEFNLDFDFNESDLNFTDGYVGPGYAIPYPEVIDTIRAAARCEQIFLDPVYTGKGFHGMCDQIRHQKLGVDRPVIFLHTGGIFSTFAFVEQILAPA